MSGHHLHGQSGIRRSVEDHIVDLVIFLRDEQRGGAGHFCITTHPHIIFAIDN
ncbi:hypothetical protein D3C78_658070 [compost metagenome]